MPATTRRRLRRWLGPAVIIPTLIGLAVGLVAVAALRSGGPALLRVQVAAGDLLLLRDGGPRLGRRAPAADVVLVQFDEASARQLGTVPTYAQDVQLYRALLADGATVVADTRMVADTAGPAASPLLPLLDGMLAAAPPGRLFRDVWLGGRKWPAEQVARYRPLMAHNLLNMHPDADSFFETRLYPLASGEADGLHETMPLIVARRALGLPQAPAAEVLAELKQCGVAGRWTQNLPPGWGLPPAWRGDPALRPSPYQLGPVSIPWYVVWFKAPLVPPGAYWIDYASAPRGLTTLSYVGATRPEAAASVRGKIVLVGYAATTDPSSDTYAIPTSEYRASASEVVAAAVETIVRPGLIRATPPWVTDAAAMLLPLVAAWAGGLLRVDRAAAAIAAVLILYLAVAVLANRAGRLTDVLVPPAAVLTAGIMAAGFHHWREARAVRHIIDLFGRYVPRAVVSQLVQQRVSDALALGGIGRDVTVLFADVRGFTSYAERTPPEEVLAQLNSLLTVMVDCTFANEGTIDKFIGDCVLVLFNAPIDQPDHPLRAVRTAWAIQQGLADHPSRLSVGIGIHRGEAIVGRIGTRERMAYTAVGRTVNVAARLCDLAGPRQVVVSDAVARDVAAEFALEPRPPAAVKGISEPLQHGLLTGPRKA
jgi:class 3 adenylate cyclase